MNSRHLYQRPAARYALILAGCALMVVTLDLFTNLMDRSRYLWDFVVYFDMAENGLVGNKLLWAPFVYRFLTPLLAGNIAYLFSVSTEMGFIILNYIGGIWQLFMVYLLAEHFTRRALIAWTAVAAIALSLYNIKYMFWDVARPDSLAYPIMIAAVLALFHKRYDLCVAVSCIGLLTREFLIVPPVVLELTLLQDYWRTRSRETLRWMIFTFVLVSLFVIVPRALIPIYDTGQYIDPVNDPGSLKNLIRAPLSERRDFNFLFNLASYFLPVLLLATPERLRRAWDDLAGYRQFILLYSVPVLVLTMYGGTDLSRFVTYLFVPLIMILVVMLRRGIPAVEVLYMLGAVAVYNKIFLPLPDLIDPILDFYGGYDNRVNVETLMRVYELATFMMGAVLLRALIVLAARRKAHQPLEQGA
ncbi:MAG TPA: hypothetical protein PKD09_25535 [Aggregatilinea sp.]|uniref:hypothetical protein n=1 Tax=Aggregatilinea sp. TaxID=2806333 RepID=UPI002C49759A|nr:hypothetical protein [Aggregatilinea sp.]HML25041.1 hypothetical protein [Aggregatilinea sp.]